MNKRQMKLGLTAWKNGYHVASWRLAQTPRDASFNIRHFIHNAQEAERGLFDFVFMADVNGSEKILDDHKYKVQGHGLTRLEPMQVLSAIAVSTQRLGLISTISTTYQHPYHIARAIATLDHISNGRAGWNIVTSHNYEEAQNFGYDKPPSNEERYGRAHESIDVVRGLWDSWEEDAFPVNQATGDYVDRSKMHVLSHEGPFFRVKGPLNVPRPIQGHPVLVTAGVSEQGHELAAKYCDVIYASAGTLTAAQEYYRSVKGRMAKYGRRPEDISILPAVMPFVAETTADAQRQVEAIQAQVRPDVAYEMLREDYGDLSIYDIDQPIPEDAPIFSPDWGKDRVQGSTFSRNMRFLARAREERWTVRKLTEQFTLGGSWQLLAVGTPKMIADQMEEWFENDGGDGFNIQAPFGPGGLTAFVNLVVPELQRRGLFRTSYEASTLRGHLGLDKRPHPATGFGLRAVSQAQL